MIFFYSFFAHVWQYHLRHPDPDSYFATQKTSSLTLKDTSLTNVTERLMKVKSPMCRKYIRSFSKVKSFKLNIKVFCNLTAFNFSYKVYKIQTCHLHSTHFVVVFFTVTHSSWAHRSCPDSRGLRHTASLWTHSDRHHNDVREPDHTLNRK